MIYLAECTALAAIFSNFKPMVSIRCFRIFADNTSRLNQLNMLYARACTWTLFAFTIRLWLLTAAKSKPDLLSLMKISSCSRHNNDPSFCSVYSILDSLRNVSWSVLNYDTIIQWRSNAIKISLENTSHKMSEACFLYDKTLTKIQKNGKLCWFYPSDMYNIG